MHRDADFLMSRKPFAVDLSTLTGKQEEHGGRTVFRGSVNAVWFRRQGGVTRACLGSLGLWSHHLPEPLDVGDPHAVLSADLDVGDPHAVLSADLDVGDPHAVLSADLDGRYGGNCHGRWDGENYWGSQKPLEQALHLTLLEPMLANFPAIPEDHDGWWTFQPPRRH
jgi:hypothetical protein